ncbi:MAG TPA: cation:proton antiporter [Candidatus Hydrogenedentes bacterium]|nr:cation:proton antiporter [Candidatus Hydrogenedentota bacterium]HOV74709.1 cation:proton antiporter [Candidatus Hydrogenedentota bacterium]
MGLAVAATSLSNHLRISVALIEICIGIAAGFVADRYFGAGSLGGDLPWLRFLAGTGAVLLTFLAGAELEPAVLRKKWKEVSIVGLIGFVAPFVGCAAVAHFVLGWDVRASGLAGVALSTTSMAVVYAVMLETGFNQTDFGKGILGAGCLEVPCRSDRFTETIEPLRVSGQDIVSAFSGNSHHQNLLDDTRCRVAAANRTRATVSSLLSCRPSSCRPRRRDSESR